MSGDYARADTWDDVMGWTREGQRPVFDETLPNRQWWECQDSVTAVGRFLVDRGWSAEELQWYYEKPYRYQEEWVAYQNRGLSEAGNL